MNRQVQPIRKLPFYGSKEGNDVGILMDSKVVVEKKSFVSTGILTYALGDIIEIELPQYDVFQLGEQVKLIVYTRSGMFVFKSTVIAKHNGSLMIINPPENRRRFNEKREHPRVDLNYTGQLHMIHDPAKDKEWRMEWPIGIAVDNISMGGLGFSLKLDLGIKQHTMLELELDLGFTMPCRTEVIRSSRSADEFYYGARYLSLPQDKSNALRAFILKHQIESYFERKKRELFNELVVNGVEPAPELQKPAKSTGMHIHN